MLVVGAASTHARTHAHAHTHTLLLLFVYPDSCPYQKDAVSNYFSVADNLPPSNLYDNQGCGYPDVSAQGVNFMVVVNGITQPVAGTSASCPTVAGIVALLNDVVCLLFQLLFLFLWFLRFERRQTHARTHTPSCPAFLSCDTSAHGQRQGTSWMAQSPLLCPPRGLP